MNDQFPKKALISFIMLLALITSGWGSFKVEDFEGQWLNVKTEGGVIARVQISKVNDTTAKVHTFRECTPEPCDLGEVNAKFEEQSVLAKYNNAGTRTTLRWSRNGSRLLMRGVIKYNDQRPDKFFTEHFEEKGDLGYAIHTIQLEPTSPNSLVSGDTVKISMQYRSLFTEGVRIYVKPYDGDNVKGNTTYSGSKLYTPQEGTASFWFQHRSSDSKINNLKFTMENDDGEALLEFDLPVDYYYRPAIDVYNISIDPPGPIDKHKKVTISYSFNHDVNGGVQIYPFFLQNGEKVGNWDLGNVPLHQDASGSFSGTTITIRPPVSGPDTVIKTDSMVFEVRNSSGTTQKEIKIPAEYYWMPQNAVYEIVMDPPSPATLTNGDSVKISFKYWHKVSGSAWIFFRPMTDGGLSANYAGAPASLAADSVGSGESFIRIDAGNIHVDSVRIQITENNVSNIVKTMYVPVDYTFEPPTGFDLSNAPNNRAYKISGTGMENGNIQVNYYLPESAVTRLEIFNTRGAVLKTTSYKYLNRGSHRLEFKVNDNTGPYYIKMESGENQITKRLTILR